MFFSLAKMLATTRSSEIALHVRCDNTPHTINVRSSHQFVSRKPLLTETVLERGNRDFESDAISKLEEVGDCFRRRKLGQDRRPHNPNLAPVPTYSYK